MKTVKTCEKDQRVSHQCVQFIKKLEIWLPWEVLNDLD